MTIILLLIICAIGCVGFGLYQLRQHHKANIKKIQEREIYKRNVE